MIGQKTQSHTFVRSRSNAGLGTSRACTLHHRCEWEKVGEFRMPARGAWSKNMPRDPDGTVKYKTFRCNRCGRTQSDEALYSFVPNEKPSAGKRNEKKLLAQCSATHGPSRGDGQLRSYR